MLREMWAQAAGALSLKDPFTGIKLSLTTVEPGAAPSGVAVSLVVRRRDRRGSRSAATRWRRRSRSNTNVRVPELVASDTLEAVLDMELPLVVRFARTVMSLKTLSGLGPGSIVDMERSPDEPVLMLIGDRVIARGEVVVVGGHYGVRVTDLVSSAERARALEG